ncbi:serine proteinase stubble-like [Artemia franciscana]|uniref:serine proteinase stubble-like n=1 Tax=Artemia franciscana TaxID=6661 RepID=UPI0032DA2894
MNVTVTGWGRLSEGGILPNVLQQVTLPVISNDKCKTMFLKSGRHEFIPDIFLCTGYDEGGRDACQPFAYSNQDLTGRI